MAEIETLTEKERKAIRDWIGNRPIVDLVHGLQCDVSSLGTRVVELDAKHQKARQRINDLEAQVTAADTVSRAEYDALVKQRDTLRQERSTALEERDTERIRVNALCEALEVARGALHDAMEDIGDALGLSDEEPQ